jgi:alginate O-acetyltransferase complex protein AlgJ
MRDLGHPKPLGFVAEDDSMLFLEGEGANAPVVEERLERITQSVAECNSILKEQGIKMVFLPVPNKESIYYDKLPHNIAPNFLSALIPKLRDRGIIVVDLYQAYTDAYRSSRSAHPSSLSIV